MTAQRPLMTAPTWGRPFSMFLLMFLLAGCLGGCGATHQAPQEAPIEAATSPVAEGDEQVAEGDEQAAMSKVVGEEVQYTAGDTTLRGFLAFDASLPGPRPAVLVVHEWWGHNDYVRRRARMLAELGYVALAVDMYGDGKHAEHPKEANAFMQEALANAEVAEARFQAGFALLGQHERVDSSRIAAIGYCFGGAVVLHMARTGTPLKGVASFHGALKSMHTPKPGEVSAKVLVMTGGADPMVPAEAVDAFKTEMDAAGADYRVVSYPTAKHAFTNPGATALGERFDMPIAYDEAADVASWRELQGFLRQIFSATP